MHEGDAAARRVEAEGRETAIVARVCVEQDDKSGLHASYLIRSRADNPPQLVS